MATSPTPAPAPQPVVSNGPIPPGSAQNNGPAATVPKAEPARMLKVKIEGREVEMPESEVLALASAGRTSTQRFQEAAAMRKQFELAKENPVEFFKQTGKNPREWAEHYLIEELKKEAESPDQRKSRENEERLRKYEADEKTQKEQAKQAEMDRLTNEHRQKFDLMFVDALNKSGLPKTPFTVKRMAELQLVNIKKKLELGPDQLAKLVREDYMNEQKSLFSAFDGDQLIDFLGPDLVKKLSKAQISKLKSRGVSTQRGSSSVSNSGKADKPGLTWREMQKRNRRPA